ncbi:hypothetical protein BRYFOR_09475 [Marvinbryantia formatexigens DSM 14469]|uniref:Uncharacterized protein n=1 Tax=Marvinbryantia formatexigens DSM 14469 TaxID=478749 RepID=C6LLC8_9FIRM|nr:hypothetical protein [Marvinbryantia formatexigens]EET58551.1 hypothetical protein BRYFOR_09475 [Marvinbryantia formatexigens DSM 14469]UWO24888.1 putative ABC transporter permease [Marvinbryantia formatexigens DSM 14469]SDG77389.1 Putative ABC-transporter type IV [Marvinbryantia formatexigens]
MKNFLKCGVCGWCLEILWTSLDSLRRGEFKLMGQSSIWMFPIYGMAAIIRPVSVLLRPLGVLKRGLLYMGGIFSMEYLTGSFLQKRGICPWDYSDAKLNYHGLIRLDYAPLWFLTGLFYEKLLKNS